MSNTENTVLIVRHLPLELSVEDREELLKHFGANRVRCFGNTGPMKHTAFASFESHSEAVKALERLHQVEILGTRLSVEFSNSQMKKHHPSMVDPAPNIDIKNIDVEEQKTKQDTNTDSYKQKVTEEINSISCRWGVDYPFNPRLRYLYPSPTVNILTNIANALASVPRFYVQVLHLMNKMNLPPPFGAVTATPPIPEGEPPPLPPLPQENIAELSEESELESDDEKPKRVNLAYKRAAKEIEKPRKRRKLQICPAVIHSNKPSQLVTKPEEIFEQSQVPLSKKIEFRLSGAIAQSLQNNLVNKSDEIPTAEMEDVNPNTNPDTSNQEGVDQPSSSPSVDQGSVHTQTSSATEEVTVCGGFGKIEPPVVKENETDLLNKSEDEGWEITEFISSRRLKRGRLSSSEAKELSILKNYICGDPTPRLYIKNLAKQTTDKDLHYIFGRYVDWDNELEKNMFDVRLMKEGRMKGQAFVTLPSEQQAEKALKETHTFVLNDKPMIVQFARSAKPKGTALSK